VKKLLVAGCWLLVATYQVEAYYEMPLVAGYWLLVATYQVEAFK